MSVLCYGLLCIDHVVRVRRYPEPNGYAPILEQAEFIGGEAANAAVALSRLGEPVLLAGNRLGDDRRGRLLLERLARYRGIDTSMVRQGADVETKYALILSALDGSRTVLGWSIRLQGEPLTETDFEGIKLLVLDPFFGKTSIAAAQLAHRLGLPVHTTEIGKNHPIADYCDVVINSNDAIGQQKRGDAATTARHLLDAGVQTVVVTSGAEGCTVFDRTLGIFRQAAFPVAVMDTLGAGDTFRAGFVYGWLRKWELPRIVKFASAVGALNCTGIGGSEHAPTLNQVEALLSRSEHPVGNAATDGTR